MSRDAICTVTGEICSFKETIIEQYDSSITPEIAFASSSASANDLQINPLADRAKRDVLLSKVDVYAESNEINCTEECPVSMSDLEMEKPGTTIIKSIKKALGI
jgi:hypothetical protein